jgi:hypothetical protein
MVINYDTCGIGYLELYHALGSVVNKDPEVEGNWHKNRKAIEQDFSRDNYASALTITARLEMVSPNLVIHIESPYKLDEKHYPTHSQ